MGEIEVGDYIVEWDDEKEKKNFKKHGIHFEDAARIFLDDDRIDDYDELHSDDEDRIQVLTLSISDKAITGATYKVGTDGTEQKATVTNDGKSVKIGSVEVDLTIDESGKVSKAEYPDFTAIQWTTLDLSTITADTTISTNTIITGTLSANVKISIADGATVKLKDVTINGTNSDSCNWAGITCLGDATIILEGTNNVKGFYEDYPGIYVPQNKTLTIQGDGTLTATGSSYGAGIGGGYQINCGNIVIEGGTITATGGQGAAGIGGGQVGSCGTVTITDGVTSVTATNPTASARATKARAAR